MLVEVAMSDSQVHDDSLSHRTATILLEQETMPTYSGMLENGLVADILRLEGVPVEDLMVRLLPKAASRAYAPISNFHVGAVSLGKSGNIYLGSNIEIPGQGLGCAVHAEQSAFANAFRHGEREIVAAAVTAAPCGHCRQYMAEFSIDMNLTIIIQGAVKTSLSKLLPEHFGPVHLGNTHGVLGSIPQPLKLFESFEAFSAEPKLEEAALEAAKKSYSPYSNSPSGAAVLTKRGRIYTGSYIENVAFNPSLPPLQAALVSLIQAGETPESIVCAVIVELKDAQITQVDIARAVLNAVHPGAQLDLVHALRAE